jgi:hypothetical protein
MVMGRRPSFAEVQKYLSGMGYPATPDQLVEHAQENGAEEDILEILRDIPDREYDGPNAVSEEVANVERS